MVTAQFPAISITFTALLSESQLYIFSTFNYCSYGNVGSVPMIFVSLDPLIRIDVGLITFLVGKMKKRYIK